MEVKCFFNIVMQHKTFTIVPNGDQNQIAFATLDTEAYRDLYYFDLQSKIVECYSQTAQVKRQAT